MFPYDVRTERSGQKDKQKKLPTANETEISYLSKCYCRTEELHGLERH